MGPGGFIKDPISAISFGMALMFGTAGLPHILMRFFTVPNAKEARKSVLWATTWIGYFYVLTFIIGFGAITFVLTDPQFLDAKGGLLGGGNMAAVHLAKAVGGNVFLGFISAVAFATILAVVAGLTLSGASAVSHDLYATVVKKGKADSASELKVSRITTVALGIVAVVLGIVFEKQNIAFMVSLAFAIAASANFPVLLMSVLWKDCTTRGAVIGGFLGLVSSVALTVVSPAVWEATLGHPAGLRAVPLRVAGAVLDDHRLRRHLAVLHPRPQPARGRRTGRGSWPAGAFGNRHRRGGCVRTLTRHIASWRPCPMHSTSRPRRSTASSRRAADWSATAVDIAYFREGETISSPGSSPRTCSSSSRATSRSSTPARPSPSYGPQRLLRRPLAGRRPREQPLRRSRGGAGLPARKGHGQRPDLAQRDLRRAAVLGPVEQAGRAGATPRRARDARADDVARRRRVPAPGACGRRRRRHRRPSRG